LAEELSPKDLKRLRLLEENIKKARERSKELTNERNQLKRNLAAAEKSISELTARLETLTRTNQDLKETRDEARLRAAQTDDYEKQIQKLAEQVSQLLVENRVLAEKLEKISGDLPILQEATSKAAEVIETAQTETTTAQKKNTILENQLVEASNAREQLRAQVELLSTQLKEQGKTPLLSADQVAELLSQLINKLRSGAEGLNFVGGEIKLKVGFGGAGELSGFLIPTPDSGPEIREVLNEIVIHFDRPLLSP
jgi:chromosome segregation ATPase